MSRKSTIFETISLSISLLSRKEKIKLILISLGSFFASIFEVIALMSVLPFLQILFDPKLLNTDKKIFIVWEFIGSPSYSQFISILAFVISLILLLSSSANLYIQISSNRFAGKCQERFGYFLFRSILSADYEWHVTQNSTLLMTLFIAHCSVWSKSVIRQIPMIIGNLSLIFIPCISLILLSPFSGLLLLLILTSILLYILRLIRIKTNKLSKASKIKQEEISIFINELFQGIKDVKLSAREDLFLKKFKRIYNISCTNLASINNWNQLPTSLILLISQLSILLVGTILVLYEFSSERILSIMSIVVLFASRIIPSINKLSNSLTGLSNTNSWIKTLKEISFSLKNFELNIANIKNNDFRWRRLRFSNVSYQYPTNKKNVINKINLDIQNGNHYGFVGLSGSGKSTIIDLFLGLLSPKEGEIRVGTKSLLEFGLRKWQLNIGYVPQKPLINNCSLKENIAYGFDKQDIDENRVIKCIEMACLKDVLSQLPDGLNSSLGDRGKFLSGGQQQRVAIARALYQDPKIIIFDEATSSQDIKNEELIRKSIDNIKGNITIISISHKFYTIKNCDHIFLINNGNIEAQGNYSQLLKESKLFRELEGSIKNQK